MTDREYAKKITRYVRANCNLFDITTDLPHIIEDAMQAKAEAILREVEPSLKLWADKYLGKKDAEYYMEGIKQAILKAEVTA